MLSPRTRDFVAWIDKLHNDTLQLIVAGDVETRSIADRPCLCRNVEAGAFGGTMRLDLSIRNNGRPDTRTLDFRPVRFATLIANGDVDTVSINWCGQTIDVLRVDDTPWYSTVARTWRSETVTGTLQLSEVVSWCDEA